MSEDRDAREALAEAVRRLGGSLRAGQAEMADRVEAALDAGSHLLVQAGTGTGKSLGYLVPVMLHAATAEERAVVSTATLALQRQVMTKDAPVAADAVEAVTGVRPSVALLKGWQNYLCRHRLAGGYPDDDADTLFSAGAATTPGRVGEADRGSVGEQIVRLREWAAETATGDRDDLIPGVSDRAWAHVSVSRAECLGPSCPLHEECFPELARAAASQADVVVTNHAMLGIAAAGNVGVLPDYRVLVVDEAHELAGRVRSQGTVSLSAAAVMRVAARMTLEAPGAVPLGEILAITRFSARVPEGRAVNIILTDTHAARPAQGRIAWPVRPRPPSCGWPRPLGGAPRWWSPSWRRRASASSSPWPTCPTGVWQTGCRRPGAKRSSSWTGPRGGCSPMCGEHPGRAGTGAPTPGERRWPAPQWPT